jgi:hypothetical protein
MSVFTNPASAGATNARAYIDAVLHMLGDQDPMQVLERTPHALRDLLAGLSTAALRTPEAPGKWSMAQVLRHLADSEIVYSWRLRMVLAHDRPPLTGYDQDLWAERLHYTDADAEESLRLFGVLRESNLSLLRRATPDDLRRVGVHAERGDESVDRIMRLYAGHDLVHERQMERIRSSVQG